MGQKEFLSHTLKNKLLAWFRLYYMRKNFSKLKILEIIHVNVLNFLVLLVEILKMWMPRPIKHKLSKIQLYSPKEHNFWDFDKIKKIRNINMYYFKHFRLTQIFPLRNLIFDFFLQLLFINRFATTLLTPWRQNVREPGHPGGF